MYVFVGYVWEEVERVYGVGDQDKRGVHDMWISICRVNS